MSTREADDGRKESELVMKPFAKWEEFFMPAPICITNLGKLMFIFAAGEDVSIHKNPLELPESFRACLQEVNNQIWWSFKNTQAIMKKIEGEFRDIPKEMTKIVLDFSQNEAGKAPSKENQEYIEYTSAKCSELMLKLNSMFSPVIDLIQKLLQACENARQDYKSELNEVHTKLEKMKQDKKKADQSRKPKTTQKDEALQQYMEAIPSPLKCIGISFLQTVIDYYGSNPEQESKSESIEGGGTGLMTEDVLSKAEQKRRMLMSILEEDERNFQRHKEQNKELMKTECDIKTYEVKEEELEKAGRILEEGLKALRSTKEQCEKMRQFLQIISSTTESCFQEYLASLQQITITTRVDRIYIPFRASIVAQFINVIFETYVKLSENYLMSLFSRLKGIFSVKLSDSTLASTKTSLDEHCENAQKDIFSLMQQKKADFMNNLNTCEKEIKAMQPSLSEEKVKEIECAMQHVISELSMQ